MTQVDFHFIAPDGSPISNGTVEVRLSDAAFRDVESGIVVPRVLQRTADDEGRLSLELWPLAGAEYTVSAVDPSSGRRARYSFHVPESTVPVRLQDIVMAVPPTRKPYDEASIEAIQANRILAQVEADRAETAASLIVGDRDAAELAAQSAETSRSVAEGHALAAGEASDQADQARAGAQLARVEAEQHALAADQARGEAVSAWAGAEGERLAAEGAAGDALAIFGSALAVSEAVTSAEAGADRAEAARDSASGHRLNAQNAANSAALEAGLANTSANAAQGAALAANSHRLETLTARDEAYVARHGAGIDRGRAEVAAMSAESTLSYATFRVDQWLTRVGQSELVLIEQRTSADAASAAAAESAGDAQAALASTQTIYDDAVALYGGLAAIDEAVRITYANRLIMNTALSTNLIILRS